MKAAWEGDELLVGAVMAAKYSSARTNGVSRPMGMNMMAANA
jgi:hypothetical protein